MSPLVSAADAGALFSATLTDTEGKTVPVARWRGKPLLVNFWARWCGPCKKEIPDLVAMQASHPGVTVLGIAIEDEANAAKVKDFAKAYDMAYPVLLGNDRGLDLMRALGNETAALPFTLAVTASGRVAFRKIGLVHQPEMASAFARALEP